MNNFYYGDYDGFDTNDDFDHESDEDFYDEDDDVWDEFFEEDNGEIIHFNAVAATILFPVDEGVDIEEIEKKADDWVEFSEEVFNKEDLVNANGNADCYTYSSIDAEQNYFCYWQ